MLSELGNVSWTYSIWNCDDLLELQICFGSCFWTMLFYDSLLLSLSKFDDIVTSNSEEKTKDMEPTVIKGSMKPPIPYNQAPTAGPVIR